MLLIGDIHINSTHKDRIVSNVRDYVALYPSEKTIVFLGDFVYHFNYDKKALMLVYDLFLELYTQGRDVYVLAGNHDWISGHFVYAEGKKTIDAWNLNEKNKDTNSGSLTFVVEPLLTTIDNQDVLLFPYHLPEDLSFSTNVFDDLLSSKNQKEQRSGRANSLLRDMLQERRSKTSRSEKILLIHHWYIEGVAFPGQFAKFVYKNAALSSTLLDMDDVMMVSGHLHQPFAHKNYFCLGSSRHTSPLEVDQQKYFGQLDADSFSLTLTGAYVNPYVLIRGDTHISLGSIDQHIREMVAKQQDCFAGSQRNIACLYQQNNDEYLPTIDLSIIQPKERTITVQTDVSYQEIESLVDQDVFLVYKDVKIKRETRPISQITSLLDVGSKELQHRIGDWKTLLTEYISQKYGTESGVYIDDLEKMNVI